MKIYKKYKNKTRMNQDWNDYSNLIGEADRLKASGEHNEAIRVCEKILLSDLDHPQAYEEIGDNYLSLRDYEKAEKALTQALRVNPGSANAHYLIGFTHSALGNWPESIAHLETAHQLQPNHPEILRCLGWSIFHSGERQQGLVLLERALNLSPRDPLILSDLGLCYLNHKEFDRANNLFLQVLEIEPDNQKVQECLQAVKFFKNEFRKLREFKKNQ